MKYRELQPAHEQCVLISFGKYCRQIGSSLKIIDRPDPPDALVEIDNKSCWIEITDAFQSSDWAQSITSYAADDKEHRPYKSRLIYNPTTQACEKVREVILNKLRKKSLNDVAKQLGKGILLVGCYTPFLSAQEIKALIYTSIFEEVSAEQSIFKSIYLYENTRSGHKFTKLL